MIVLRAPSERMKRAMCCLIPQFTTTLVATARGRVRVMRFKRHADEPAKEPMGRAEALAILRGKRTSMEVQAAPCTAPRRSSTTRPGSVDFRDGCVPLCVARRRADLKAEVRGMRRDSGVLRFCARACNASSYRLSLGVRLEKWGCNPVARPSQIAHEQRRLDVERKDVQVLYISPSKTVMRELRSVTSCM